LRARYVDEGRSLAQIAAELGCSKQLVHAWLRAHGIPARAQTRFAQLPALADRAWLRERYVMQGRTIPEIAAEVGCGATTVQRALRVHGIRARAPRVAREPGRRAPGADRLEDGAWLRARYLDEGMSCRQIAEELGCAKMTVYRALRRHGIDRRQARNRRHDPACAR
jgi:transposase